MANPQNIPDTFLSTSEVIAITGISRYTVRHYVDIGVAQPHIAGKKMFWSFDQLSKLELAHALAKEGIALPDIAQMQRSDGGLLSASYSNVFKSLRGHRRQMKGIEHLRCTIKQFSYCGIREGYYLRYLPERWLAVIPVSRDADHFVEKAEYARNIAALRGVSDAVGWSAAFDHGVLKSLSADHSQATNYIFTELTTPPLPYITANGCVDGGCYEEFGGDMCPFGEERACTNCARFGHAPTEKERSAWRHAQISGQIIERTVDVNQLAEPYVCGLWSEYTQDIAAGRAERYKKPVPLSRPGEESPAGVSARPRLMPQSFTLPLGVTACVLPAGFYLCRQSTLSDKNRTIQRLMGAYDIMPRRTMDANVERELSKKSLDLVKRDRAAVEYAAKRQADAFMEPFAMPRQHGDAALFNWVKPLADRDIVDLTLFVDTALRPEDGYLVMHQEVPLLKEQVEDPVHEFQVLVDPGPYLPTKAEAEAALNAPPRN